MKDIKKIVMDHAREMVLRGRRYGCPICNKRYSYFLPYEGIFPSYNALCPGCYSLERHRTLWLCLQYLQARGDLRLKGKMLHVAPELSLAKKFKSLFDYLSVDMDASKAMKAADITRLGFPDNNFHAIVCNHVLEHVPSDRQAMSELYRVLKPGGWASLQVPRTESLTDEDPTVTDPQERLRRFGQEDHVRLYGKDYFDRLREAGFRVEVLKWMDFLSKGEADYYVLPIDEEMVIGWKP